MITFVFTCLLNAKGNIITAETTGTITSGGTKWCYGTVQDEISLQHKQNIHMAVSSQSLDCVSSVLNPNLINCNFNKQISVPQGENCLRPHELKPQWSASSTVQSWRGIKHLNL